MDGIELREQQHQQQQQHKTSTSPWGETNAQTSTMYSNEDQSTQSTATWLRRASWDKETESSSTLPEPTRPAAMAEAKDYSDLEVVSVIPASYDGARDKMAVIVDTSEKSPAGTQQTDGVNTGVSMLSPSLADPVPAYPASIRSSTGLTGAAMTKGGDYAEWEQRNAQSVRAGQKRFFGMNSRSLSFLAIAAIAFILILLATVLGITLTMKLNAHNSASSAQSASASGGSGSNKTGILSSSRLGAMNWTDTLGTSRTAVFYQDSYNAIMVSIMDSVSNEWTQSNVTQSVMNSTGASKVDVMTGTPFAAVTNRYQISLYYFTSANDVAEAYSSDIVSGTWQAGSLESSLSTQALLGSSLTAYWQVCTNCTGSLCVSYQDTTGRVQLANLTNNAWQFSGPVNPSGVTVLNGTGLSLQPFTEANVTSAVGTDPQGLKMFAFEEAGLLDFEIGLATNYTWKEKVASTAFQSTLAADPSPELAAITYGAHGLTNCLVNYLTPTGAIMSYVYNGTKWTTGQPSLKGGGSATANFSAVATAQNMRVYGLTNGSIYEYEVDSTNPLSWSKSTTVFTSA